MNKPLSIDILDLSIRDLMTGIQQVSFVQIGAHDGATLDPIHQYVSAFWSGIVCEPQPEMCQKLKNLYKFWPRIKGEQCVVTDHDGESELFMFAENSNLPYHATMLASLSRWALENNGHGYKGEIVSMKVPCLTPRSLLDKHGMKSVDVLQIDTEGHDGVIILEFFKGGIFPKLIHFESALITEPTVSKLKMQFSDHGYRVSEIGVDSVAYQQKPFGTFEERIGFH